MAAAHARWLAGTQKPYKCAKRLGVRRLDAAFAVRRPSFFESRAVMGESGASWNSAPWVNGKAA